MFVYVINYSHDDFIFFSLLLLLFIGSFFFLFFSFIFVVVVHFGYFYSWRRKFAAVTLADIMDRRISGKDNVAEAAICCTPFAGGGRQNVRKIYGICARVHPTIMRITRITRL